MGTRFWRPFSFPSASCFPVGWTWCSSALRRGLRYLCCWVGVMGQQDRLDLLLRSIHHVVHDIGRRDCEFAIIGDGECLAEAGKLASDLGLNDWVQFTGWLPEDQVFRYLA